MRKSRYDVLLATFISLTVVVAAIGGFLIGRHITRDAFIEKVSTQGAVEKATLVSAGTAPLSLNQIIGRGVDDPLTEKALANAYGVPDGDRDALAKRLSETVWLPPYRPAPFVGHIARPYFGNDLHINVFGFRDDRQTYVNKPERTVRIFITGGSAAWGVGTSSQKNTISTLLEKMLNDQVGRTTGYQYEVINTAFPAWSTTQEKILIQQRLVDMHPDVILMFSGNNDIHWALHGSDIRWFYSYMDQNYITLLNEMYKSSGHPEWVVANPVGSRPVECSQVAEVAARNVEEAAAAAERVNAQLFFVLQPNIISTTKRLTEHEQRILQGQDKPYWDSCYQALRVALAQIKAKNYRFIDLSRSFGALDGSTELFIDAYHVADMGNQLIARDIAEQINWETVVPSGTRAAVKDPH